MSPLTLDDSRSMLMKFPILTLMPTNKRLRIYLLILAVIKIIIPYLLQNNTYEPHRDEFLYLAEGHHLAWGFMEVPPMLSIFAWLTHCFGDSMFWLKLWPSLFGAATFILGGEIIISLGGRLFALILMFLPFIFGGYLRVFFLFQPNAPEIFFWTLILFAIVRFIQTKRNTWLYVLGVAVGLGMMSKYSVAFFTASLLLALLCTKHRSIFANKHFWLASVVGLIIFLPNIIWQFQHHLPVVHHMKELQQTQLQYLSPTDFLKGQLLMNLPCVFIWIAGLWFTAASKTYRFVALTYAFVLIILLLSHGKDYYLLGAYPALFAFGAYYLEKITSVKIKFLRVAFIIFVVSLGIFTVPVALPVFEPARLAVLYEKMNIKKTGALRWEDLRDHALPQDFADMLGWEEMAKKMSKAYEMLDSNERKRAILFCDNYGMAGAVTFYAKKYNIPYAYSDNASFLYWLPDNIHIDNLVLLTDDTNEMQHDFIKDFTSATIVDSIVTPMARERGDLVILLKGANEAFNQFFIGKIQKDKEAFK